MTKIYHFSTKLIIMDKQHKKHRYDTTQGMMLSRLGASVQVIYEAHEIWMYNRATSRFEMYKNKCGIKTLLEKFFESKNINLKCDTAVHDSQACGYRFKEPKDKFHFKLKF